MIDAGLKGLFADKPGSYMTAFNPDDCSRR